MKVREKKENMQTRLIHKIIDKYKKKKSYNKIQVHANSSENVNTMRGYVLTEIKGMEISCI